MEQFGRYVLVERIAAGGMAEIWRGASTGVEGFSRPLAIKRILPEWVSDPEFVNMLVDEAKIASSLHHPNVIQVTDLGSINGQYFIAMEYVAGKHFGFVIGGGIKTFGGLPLPFTLLCVRDALLGLGHAHAKTTADGKPLGIVHRDISPQNLMMGYDGSVRVADFGIAKAMGRLTQTDAGRRKGKYAYMSPEQARGDELDNRSDLYAMGVVLWEALAGRRLYPPQLDHMEIINLVGRGQRRPLAEVAPNVPPDVMAVVDRALMPAREDRYKDAEEFASALSKLLGVHAPGYALPDAAKLMKELFGGEAEDERKKLAELESITRRMTNASLPAVQVAPPAVKTPAPAAPVAPQVVTVSPSAPTQEMPVTRPEAVRTSSQDGIPRRARTTGSHARVAAGPPWSVMAGGLLLLAGVVAVGAVVMSRSVKVATATPPPTAHAAPAPAGAAMNTTQVTFESNPPGAVVAVDGEYKGATPLTVSLPRGKPTRVLLERHNFEPSVLDFTPTGDNRTVMVELRPAQTAPKAPKKGAPPTAGAVETPSAVKPAGGAPSPSSGNKGPPTTAAKPPSADEPAPAPAPEQPAPVASPASPKLTEVTIESRPSGAQVQINGKSLGPAPLDVLLQPNQHYIVKADAPGHEPVTRDLEPVGSSLKILLELKSLTPQAASTTAVAAPAPPPPTKPSKKEERYQPPEGRVGTLSIFSTPPAHVFIDGKATGEETPLLDLPVSPGKHTIGLISVEEGINTSFPMEVEAGKNHVVNKKLQ